MSLPTSIVTPSRCDTSRTSASVSVSLGSTRPPGNSQSIGSTAVGRRCVMRYFPSREMTAATTRMGRVDVGAGMPKRRLDLHVDSEELLPHEQHVARRERVLRAEPNERAVRATHVREVHVAVLLTRD